jgi:hypothetical protein
MRKTTGEKILQEFLRKYEEFLKRLFRKSLKRYTKLPIFLLFMK